MYNLAISIAFLLLSVEALPQSWQDSRGGASFGTVNGNAMTGANSIGTLNQPASGDGSIFVGQGGSKLTNFYK